MLQKIQTKKKLTITLFIDVKRAFDHDLKKRLIKQMIKLRIDGN